MIYNTKNEKDIWNSYLNEIRHDVIAKQKQIVSKDMDIELLGRIIYYVKSFAKSAREYGLLAMEEEAEQLDLENPAEKILYEAVRLIVDGSSPECVAEIMSNDYWISELKGDIAAAAYMGIRGMLMVQEEANPYSIWLTVSSILPMEIREKCKEVCQSYEMQKQKKEEETARVYFETDFSRCESLVVRNALEMLERELLFMTDIEIQRLLRDVENHYLVQALLGMKQKARQAIVRNMSARLRGMIMEECYQIADINDGGIAEGAVYVTEKLKVLQACGEIMDAEERLLCK